MATYRTPGVYVQEISTLPPSVAEVATAIPAFIGYTKTAVDDAGKEIEAGKFPVVRRITSMLEYNRFFGGPQEESFNVVVDGETTTVTQTTTGAQYLLYYALLLYFQNGGGPCYIVSVGKYKTAMDKEDFIGKDGLSGGFGAIATVDEPTLLLCPDAVNLPAGYYDVCNAALAQCEKLKDRFAILDVLKTDTSASGFRQGILSETDFLKYGAAYLPFLETTIPYTYADQSVTVDIKEIRKSEADEVTSEATIPAGNTANLLTIRHVSTTPDKPKVVVVVDATFQDAIEIVPASNLLTIKLKEDTGGQAIVDAWTKLSVDKKGFSIEIKGDGGTITTADVLLAEKSKVTIEAKTPVTQTLKLPDLNKGDETGRTALYSQVKQALAKYWVTLPPSPAIAGAYARVDRIRGVWKSPANVSVVGIVGPSRLVTSEEQEKLNVDEVSGKSINVIRSFTGKGTLVWGARTLAGNDNEWRYIAVRRLFNLIEESVQKATSFAVFEPNDAGTWLKVKAMIDSYLYGLWQQGALAGSVPEQAYFVNVGLGKTMTTQDILEGRMNVEIGLAAVRPAEFIILKFSHKLQEA